MAPVYPVVQSLPFNSLTKWSGSSFTPQEWSALLGRLRRHELRDVLLALTWSHVESVLQFTTVK